MTSRSRGVSRPDGPCESRHQVQRTLRAEHRSTGPRHRGAQRDAAGTRPVGARRSGQHERRRRDRPRLPRSTRCRASDALRRHPPRWYMATTARAAALSTRTSPDLVISFGGIGSVGRRDVVADSTARVSARVARYSPYIARLGISTKSSLVKSRAASSSLLSQGHPGPESARYSVASTRHGCCPHSVRQPSSERRIARSVGSRVQPPPVSTSRAALRTRARTRQDH